MRDDDDPPKASTAPGWSLPAKYGYAEAVTMAGSVAAPLLAGFSVTSLGIVVASGHDIRFPGLAALLLACAAIVLLFAVQAAFTARVWQVGPNDLSSWFPAPDSQTLADLVEIQRAHEKNQRSWAALFRWSYNGGLLLLLCGIAATLPPVVGHPSTARWAAAIVVSGAAVGEFVWMLWGD